MEMIAKILLAVLVMTLALRSAVSAQGQSLDPKACSDAARDSSNQTLSEKLDQSNGVICPPNVDPGIRVPTPDAGKTPIIPPPGSPGGDPNVQPK